MDIHLSGKTEELISQQVASGRFASAEEAVAAMAEFWHEMRGSLPMLPDDIDIEQLAAAQKVGPINDPQKLKATFWPDDEGPDDFVNEIRRLREQGEPRQLP